MNHKIRLYGIYAFKAILALAFISAGTAKLVRAEQMVAVFEMIGVGQWFRYVTGIIEIVSGLALFVSGVQVFGAIILVCTMIGAVLSHLFILGPSAFPAAVLGVLAAIVAYVHRDQIASPKLGDKKR